MSDLPPISADLPELKLMAVLAEIPPSRLADAINDPNSFFFYLSLEELERFTDAFNRLWTFRVRMMAAMKHATTALEAITDHSQKGRN